MGCASVPAVDRDRLDVHPPPARAGRRGAHRRGSHDGHPRTCRSPGHGLARGGPGRRRRRPVDVGRATRGRAPLPPHRGHRPRDEGTAPAQRRRPGDRRDPDARLGPGRRGARAHRDHRRAGRAGGPGRDRQDLHPRHDPRRLRDRRIPGPGGSTLGPRRPRTLRRCTHRVVDDPPAAGLVVPRVRPARRPHAPGRRRSRDGRHPRPRNRRHRHHRRRWTGAVGRGPSPTPRGDRRRRVRRPRRRPAGDRRRAHREPPPAPPVGTRRPGRAARRARRDGGRRLPDPRPGRGRRGPPRDARRCGGPLVRRPRRRDVAGIDRRDQRHRERPQPHRPPRPRGPGAARRDGRHVGGTRPRGR